MLEESGFWVCASVGDGDSAVEAARRERPALCLLDIAMPGDGIAATARIALAVPETVIVMLTVSRSDDDLFRALQAGASGYLLKDTKLERLPDLLEAALEGEALLSGTLAARVVGEFRERGRRGRLLSRRKSDNDLTRREWEVLGLLAEDLTTAEIARRLFIEQVTVRTHVAAVRRKLQVPTREAARRLWRESRDSELELG